MSLTYLSRSGHLHPVVDLTAKCFGHRPLKGHGAKKIDQDSQTRQFEPYAEWTASKGKATNRAEYQGENSS